MSLGHLVCSGVCSKVLLYDKGKNEVDVFQARALFIVNTHWQQESGRRRKSSTNDGILPTFSTEEAADQWSISLFQIKYTTQKCNNLFQRLAHAAPRFWQIWFSIGTIVALAVMAVGLVVIAYAAWRIIAVLWYALRPTTTTDTSNAMISSPNRFAKRAFEQDVNNDVAMVDDGGGDNGGQVFQPMVSSFNLVRYGCCVCVTHTHTHGKLTFFSTLDPRNYGSIITPWILLVGITRMWCIS